jgi:hypothetical protein
VTPSLPARRPRRNPEGRGHGINAFDPSNR